jgi:hypothetical protein
VHTRLTDTTYVYADTVGLFVVQRFERSFAVAQFSHVSSSIQLCQ